MNQKRLRQMYGSTPPGFEQRVQAALSGQSPRAEAGCGGRLRPRSEAGGC